ncbi:MAG: NAD(+) synthase [Planctomycetota bacterium]
MGTFHEPQSPVHAAVYREIPFEMGFRPAVVELNRQVSAYPFVPCNEATLRERCEEIFHIQTSGLAKRIEVARPQSLEIGVSGGLDSTLGLLVAVKTCDMLGLPRKTVHGITMPGFGTSDRTLRNARQLMELTGIRAQVLDIRPLCLDAFKGMGHQPFGIDLAGMDVDQFVAVLAQIPSESRQDLVFENVQARIRTLNLMNYGFVIGTGDLSELALGWCTYNGDHMGMYNPNASVPKTLVRFLVKWVADHEFEGPAREVLHSIAETEISPELLPLGTDAKIQSTEETIGPYELLDFYLYHLLRFGFRPRKILYLAERAKFSRPYSRAEHRHWLSLFLKRFFSSQFKRSCLPDGPKVGSVSLSPRGDWRMPSDAEASLWLEELDAMDRDAGTN